MIIKYYLIIGSLVAFPKIFFSLNFSPFLVPLFSYNERIEWESENGGDDAKDVEKSS